MLRLNPWLAAAGAIAFTFSSYNFILLHAGHSNQAYAITFFAPILAGIILTLRGKYWLGAVLTAFFLAMEIRSNHIQMAYYLMISLLILVGIELYHAIKNKTTVAFIRSMAWLSVATLIAVMINASLLWTTYEYGKESTRGKSNLTQPVAAGSTTGLDKEYAYGWSQGVGECITFLIPDTYGGESAGGTLKADSKVAQALLAKGVPEDQATGFAAQLPTYWGAKPSTAGPWYFGAGICFLFVFGLLIIRNRIKWWLLATVILSMLLSFGKNFTLVSDLFFNYFPLYNKFRAVESILVLTQLAFPILGFLAIKEVLQAKDKAFILKKLLLALYITGGITLLVAALPSLFFSFKSTTADESLIAQLTQAFQGDSAFANSIVNNALVQDRIGLARADAIRSLIFVLLTFGVLWAFIKQKINLQITSLLILAVTLVDLWSVDKRYLKDESFQPKEDAMQVRTPREVDQFIMRDTDPDFRVLDLTIDPFANASTSYFHKTLGGYHAAKLKRFQELIDNQFTKSINPDVLDMLNTKYVITADPKSQTAGMKANATACGHAWFVKKVRFADNADQEMQAISSFDPKNEAIVDIKYQSYINTKQNAIDENGKITLTSYAPEHLVYQSGSTTNQVAVFSEIYYDKGWKMLIDGKESPYFRADYLLRAAQIPVGNHKIEFIFHPNSYYTGEAISTAGSILLVLAFGGYVFAESRKKRVVKTV
ncbi:YfhO family protein [uncultured Mucilaginibacter sp.]|uniref:YfhO family protein n=1 Tax=uncultured Mucilaginibacter sp. TaxID=797541 RepID=UPI00344F5007